MKPRGLLLLFVVVVVPFAAFGPNTLLAQDNTIFDKVKVTGFQVCNAEMAKANTCPQTKDLPKGYALKGKGLRMYLEKTEGTGKDKKTFFTCQASERPGGNDNLCDNAGACNCRLFELDPKKKGAEWTLAQNQVTNNVTSANEFAVPKKGFEYACICKK